ncbi:MAG: hypothetical protein HYY42_02830 [Chloroflexi bacterium]|nr:hypothetical protein [Chloroflexota bacterium]
MRTGLILVAIVFATGVTAAVVADALQAAPSPTPRIVPPVATGRATPPVGRQLVPAPIDQLDIRILESAPPRYVAGILAGLPSGCAQQGGHTVTRAGDTITIAVTNSMPTGNPVCTMIYGTYELSIDLGSDLKRGVTYTVRVNDRTTTFVGQ